MFALESAGNHKGEEKKQNKKHTELKWNKQCNTNRNQKARTHFTFILMTITELSKRFLSNHQALSLLEKQIVHHLIVLSEKSGICFNNVGKWWVATRMGELRRG